MSAWVYLVPSQSLGLMDGSLVLGTGSNGFESTVKPVEIPIAALTRHICILGTTGSGKSTTAWVIAAELASKGIPTVILDRTGEYAGHLGRSERTTVFEPGKSLIMALFEPEPGVPIPVQVEGWLGVLNHFMSVTYGAQISPLQSRVLREVLTQYYTGTKTTLTISGLISKLEAYESRVRHRGGWEESIEALISRLVPLTVDLVGKTFNCPYSTAELRALFQSQTSIIDMSPMEEDGAKNLLSQLVLKRVYQEMKSRGIADRVGLVVILDEAQHLAPNGDYISIPERCAVELRKYGFSLVTIATRPSLISPNILSNSSTVICHLLTSERDIEAVANFFLDGADNRALKLNLRTLTTGNAMVQLNFPKPLRPLHCEVSVSRLSAAPGGVQPQGSRAPARM